jgi:hypothetical protein
MSRKETGFTFMAEELRESFFQFSFTGGYKQEGGHFWSPSTLVDRGVWELAIVNRES